MSAVCILTPVVIAAWPTFSAAVVAAASSLGYTVADHLAHGAESVRGSGLVQVQLEIVQSELVTEQLGRQQQLCVERDGVRVVFSRDARGKAAVCVTGEGRTKEELRMLGEELSGRVVQRYVHQRLLEEMSARGFLVVAQETDENHAIKMTVRHWEN